MPNRAIQISTGVTCVLLFAFTTLLAGRYGYQDSGVAGAIFFGMASAAVLIFPVLGVVFWDTSHRSIIVLIWTFLVLGFGAQLLLVTYELMALHGPPHHVFPDLLIAGLLIISTWSTGVAAAYAQAGREQRFLGMRLGVPK